MAASHSARVDPAREWKTTSRCERGPASSSVDHVQRSTTRIVGTASAGQRRHGARSAHGIIDRCRTTTPSTTGTDPRAGPGRTVSSGMILALVCVGQFMVVLDLSIVNVALPSMQRDLGFTTSGLQWVVNAYALSFGGFLLLGGRAADLFGRRRIFMLGLFLFAGASLVCAVAQNQFMLVGARALQGLGAAVLVAGHPDHPHHDLPGAGRTLPRPRHLERHGRGGREPRGRCSAASSPICCRGAGSSISTSPSPPPLWWRRVSCWSRPGPRASGPRSTSPAPSP